MHITRQTGGHIIIDDMGKVGQIEAAGDEIRGDEDGYSAGVEVAESGFADGVPDGGGEGADLVGVGRFEEGEETA